MKLSDFGITYPSDWKEKSVAELTVKVGSGATPRGGKSVYVETGIPFIRSQNVYDHSFKEANLAFIDNDAATQLKSVELLNNDILLNITGDSILRCCVLPDKFVGGRVNQHVAIVRPSEIVVPLFLQKWLTSPVMKSMMLIQASGGTRKAITKQQILHLPVALPPMAEQRRIAGLLGALDDKIESNRKIYTSMLSLIDGYAAKLGQDLPTVPLSECAILQKAIWKPETSSANTVDLYSLPAFDEGMVPQLAVVSDIKSNKERIEEPSILISRLNPRFNRTWWVIPSENRTSVCSPEFLHLTAPSLQQLVVIWLAVRSSQFLKELPERVTGTSGSHQRVRPADVLSILVPDFHEIDRTYIDVTLALLTHSLLLRQQNALLTELRDTLLPELMSGRMRVDEARGLVMEALDAGGTA